MKQTWGFSGMQMLSLAVAVHWASQQAVGDRPGSHCSPAFTTPLPHRPPTRVPLSCTEPPVHENVPLKAVLVEFAVPFTDSVPQSAADPLTLNTPVPVSMVPASVNGGSRLHAEADTV